MDLQGNNLRDFLQNNGHVVLQKVDNNSSLRYFTEDELRHITNGYSTLLGKGAFGEVYKGVMENQSTVAVKRYIHGTRKEEFAKEVIVHSQVNHKNVVRLFGCCTEENALMIVMEFISNGNLHNLLHCSYNNGRIPFPLERRLDIAIQVSEVLWCMHSMYSPVLHGDIKPANILLDKYLTPKISDFGIARMISADGSQYTNNVIGSIGYLDPAYCETGILTPKSDVYSFGVVLLEIITRKKAVDGTVILAQCFSEASDNVGNIIHMLDEDISDTRSMKFLEDIGKLAARCLVRDVKMRPEMIEVVISLMMIQKAFHKELGNLCQTNNSALNTSSPLSDDASKGHQLGNLIVFQEEEISRMVKNYGMTSTKGYREGLYHGFFCKDCPVIVRILKTSLETERQLFRNTMNILSQKNHKFIANVVGFYLGNSVSACVHLANRNLYGIITSTDKLPLHQRLSIVVKCAEGLLHIHSLAAEDPDSYGTSLFGNFRSENILLDSNYVPKVFNANLSTFFGLSTAQRNSTTTLGTNNHRSEKNYLDPRDVSGQILNQKSDVYSFGVVLLELMTWKTVRYMLDGRAHLLTADFVDTYRKDRNAIEVFGKVFDEQGACFLHEAIAIAFECLVLDFKKRPELSYVLSRLRIISSAQNIRSRLKELRKQLREETVRSKTSQEMALLGGVASALDNEAELFLAESPEGADTETEGINPAVGEAADALQQLAQGEGRDGNTISAAEQISLENFAHRLERELAAGDLSEPQVEEADPRAAERELNALSFPVVQERPGVREEVRDLALMSCSDIVKLMSTQLIELSRATDLAYEKALRGDELSARVKAQEREAREREDKLSAKIADLDQQLQNLKIENEQLARKADLDRAQLMNEFISGARESKARFDEALNAIGAEGQGLVDESGFSMQAFFAWLGLELRLLPDTVKGANEFASKISFEALGGMLESMKCEHFKALGSAKTVLPTLNWASPSSTVNTISNRLLVQGWRAHGQAEAQRRSLEKLKRLRAAKEAQRPSDAGPAAEERRELLNLRHEAAAARFEEGQRSHLPSSSHQHESSSSGGHRGEV